MTGFVYAIESGEAVKIGWAKDPARRLAELNVGSPLPLVLLGAVQGTKHDEAAVHRRLSAHRIRGEWFRCEGAVVEFLSHLLPFAYRAAQPPKPISGAHGKLSEFLLSSKMTEAEFARRVGVSQQAVNFWRAGTRIPRIKQMQRIHVATDGMVGPSDFIFPEGAPSASHHASEGATA